MKTIRALRGGLWLYIPDWVRSAFRNGCRCDSRFKIVGVRLTKVRRTEMKAHKHAKNMLRYAQDAAETPAPWEKWEIKLDEKKWFPCTYSIPFDSYCQYRRKPDCHNQEGAEFGGECYFNTCEHHLQDEPMCGAEYTDPYAELKKARNEGKTIEYRDPNLGSIWQRIDYVPNWIHPVEYYRIKPETKKMWQWAYKFPKSDSNAIYISNQFFACEQDLQGWLCEPLEAWKLPWTEIEV